MSSSTYEQLWRDSRSIAGGLQRLGIAAGDRVALMLPTGKDYFHAFFGVLLTGAVPVPLYPPARLSQIEDHVRRHTGILRNAGAVVLITMNEMRRVAALLLAHAPTLRRIATNEQLRAQHTVPLTATSSAASTALLQYTSGSTGQPKGVALSHANIIANISALGSALKVTGARCTSGCRSS